MTHNPQRPKGGNQIPASWLREHAGFVIVPKEPPANDQFAKNANCSADVVELLNLKRIVMPNLQDEITRLRAENERLRNAAKALYFAGVWHCDREVDEAALWIEMRDALSLEEGSATKAGVAGK